MADFRKWFTVLAVLAVMACTASAQVGTISGGGAGSSAGLLACVATAAGTPELRPEGFTELVGDIVITCTGGPVPAQGSAIPTTNIVVYMAPSVPITSRYMGSGFGIPTGASEALLIIDEAGSNVQTGATNFGGGAGFGPQAPQVLCKTSDQQASGGSTCAVKVGMDASGFYTVPVPGTNNTATTAQNVYQGKVGDFGAHTVAFYNVPVLPPSTAGVTRTFRITNVRIPVAGQNLSGTLQAIISTSPSQILPITGTAINIGIVGPPTNMAVRSARTFQQCNQTGVFNNAGDVTGVAFSAGLTFTEGFATAFKTRVVPLTNTTYAAEGTNITGTPAQNIPGGQYGGFAANSESGFIFPQLSATSGSTLTYYAGLADFGTRLKAVFTNIPTGLTLYVATASGPTPSTPIGGTSVSPYAVLVATNSGEATPDNTNTTGFTPIAPTINGPGNESNFPGGYSPAGDAGVIALTPNSSGVATAVWEVTNANPSAQDSLTFNVYVAYKPTAATTTNQYGTPITGLPLGSPVPNVSLSFAPEPGGGTFSATSLQGFTLPIPRFQAISPKGGQFITINLCQTTLLYPFVTGAAGFDTGIAVANTSMDPWNTRNQIGSCTLYGYGVTVGTTGNTAVQTKVDGCDAIANPLEGTNCFGVVPAGQVKSVMASSVLQNFQGYVIAVCNFQYAHGYAAVTDLGLRNLWSSYLALELAPPLVLNCSDATNCTTKSGGVGSPRNSIQSIESLVH